MDHNTGSNGPDQGGPDGVRADGTKTAKRKGRGRAPLTLSLLDALIRIAEEIHPCSVRALAYRLFIEKLIASMELKYTRKVSELSVIAREEGMMPWEWIVDATRAEQRVPTWEDPAAYADTVQRCYRRNKWLDQPVHVSVWSEKGTVEGTIAPVLNKYEVPFQILHGFSGATAVWDAAVANLDRCQRTLILYVGDWDPSGMNMSESDLPKRLARYMSSTPQDKEVDLAWTRDMLDTANLEIRRIALTKDDTITLGQRLGFPASDKGPKPGKNGKPATKGDPRYPWFVRNHGDWCWELDALSPNVLRDRLEQAILSVLDPESWDRYTHVEEQERDAIIKLCTQWASISVPVQE
jgi:hypothetical protein